MSGYNSNGGTLPSGSYGKYIEDNSETGGGSSTVINFSNYFSAGSIIQSVQSDLGLSVTTGKVTAWADQSGNAWHYTQGTGAAQPATSTGLNGFSGVLFDGVDDKLVSTLALPAPSAASPVWVGMVFRQITWNNVARIIGDATDAMLLYNTPGTPSITQYNGANGPVQDFTLNNWECTESEFSNTSSNYTKRGSQALVTGVASGLGVGGASRFIGGNGIYANIELLHLMYVIAPTQNQKNAWRAAVASKYGSGVSA